MNSRIHNFQQDKESIGKYRQGLQLLREARVDLILLELSSAEPVDITHPRGTEMAAAQHYERLGYQKCVADLFSLAEIQLRQTAPVADYGAIERMLEDGTITKEQANDLSGGL